MEQRNVLVGTRQLAGLSVGIGVPLSPLKTFTLHLSGEILKDLYFLETYN